MAIRKSVDLWLHSRFAEETERIRARLIVHFAAIAALFAFCYLLLTLINRLVEVRYMMLSDVVLFGLVVLLLRKSDTTRPAAQLLVLVCWLTTFGLIYFSGGTHSVILAWLPLVPLVALLLINRTWAWIWLGLTTLQVFAFWLADYLQLALPHYPSTFTNLYIVPAVVGLLVFLLWFTQIFDTQQRRLRQAFQATNRQLTASEIELRRNLEELRATQHIISQREHELRMNKQKLERNNLLLMELVKATPIQQGYLEEAIREILTVATDGIQVSRASIWVFDEKPSRITCALLYRQNEKTFERGAVLHAADYPQYFLHIRSEGIIAVCDARTNAATSEFKEGYLIPLDIHSMLDVPFYVNGHFHGLLCFEQQQAPRDWSAEDGAFAKSLADMTSLAFVSANRRAGKEQIIAQGVKIMEQHDQLKAYASEIQQINEQLEKRVIERTERLVYQNERLREYAFINAHLLRGPSARIQGLISLLISGRLSKEDEQQALDYLEVSGEELDKIIRKINRTLEAGEQEIVST